MNNLLVINPSLLTKAHVSAFTRKDGAFVAEHDDKRAAAKPKQAATHDEWAENVKATHGNVAFKKDAKSGAVHAWSGANHVGSYRFAQGGNPASHHVAAKPDAGRGIHHSVAAGLKDHLISGEHETFKKVAHHLGHPEWKAAPSKSDLAGVDGKKLQEAHDHLYSGKELPQAESKPADPRAHYAEKRKAAGVHGQAALDAAEKARNSQDPAHAAEAISAVEKGWNAHKEAGKAARAVPYPGNSSPWEHHDERASALSKMSEEMHQLHQKLSKPASKKAGPKPGHMDVSNLAAGHHLFDKSGQKVDEVESVEKHPMGGFKVNTRAGYSHMVAKDGRNDHGLTSKAPTQMQKSMLVMKADLLK
jgi:hypothetical protein